MQHEPFFAAAPPADGAATALKHPKSQSARLTAFSGEELLLSSPAKAHATPLAAAELSQQALGVAGGVQATPEAAATHAPAEAEASPERGAPAETDARAARRADAKGVANLRRASQDPQQSSEVPDSSSNNNESSNHDNLEDLSSSEKEVVVSMGLLALLLIVAASFFIFLAAKRLHHQVLQLPLLATLLGLLLGAVLQQHLQLQPRSSSSLRGMLALKEEVFFVLLLPPIVFQGGLEITEEPFASAFAENFGSVLWLATAATLCSTLIIGVHMLGAGMLLPGVSLTTRPAFAMGALISATDPVSLLSAFRDMKATLLIHVLMYKHIGLNREENLAMEVALLLLFPWIAAPVCAGVFRAFALLAECVVFVYLGLAPFSFDLLPLKDCGVFVAAGIAVIAAARGRKVLSAKEQHAIALCGLRGTVGASQTPHSEEMTALLLVLALRLAQEDASPPAAPLLSPPVLPTASLSPVLVHMQISHSLLHQFAEGELQPGAVRHGVAANDSAVSTNLRSDRELSAQQDQQRQLPAGSLPRGDPCCLEEFDMAFSPSEDVSPSGFLQVVQKPASAGASPA
ncbi:uncharacterized protein LOC34618207 [Cyclospora cayetanensis]|uniref:Uncharacterized protein LOC34618207 n=1 Tax=Cyclospora cayetanensis TaxID=88456 RepID=A0A6P6S531_9EIME|nr:uncharacterized protein LOC34618207 [Cyclospora cayetanensis]